MKRGWKLQKDIVPGLIDPDRVPDVFTEGIALIELAGTACLRFTFYATRDMGDGDIDRIVVARIVAPGSDLMTWLRQGNAVLAGQPFLHACAAAIAELH